MADFEQDFQLLFDSPWFWVLIIWSMIWKGLALWKAARNSHNVWFIVLLILNTLGILEIIYYYIFSNRKNSQVGS